MAKLHVGGYFDPQDQTVMAFQKLKVDLRRSQQDMLMEALQDFVAKHEAASAFRGGQRPAASQTGEAARRQSV